MEEIDEMDEMSVSLNNGMEMDYTISNHLEWKWIE